MDVAWMAFSQMWQLTVLVVVVWLSTRWIAHNRPHLAHLLWVVVLLKCVTPPLWSSPTGAFSWLCSTRMGRVPFERGAMVELQPHDVASTWPPLNWNEQPGLTFPSAGDSIDKPTRRGRGSWTLMTASFLVAWGAGVALALLLTGYRWLYCLWRIWRRPVDKPVELEQLVRRLAKQLRLRRRVRLLVTDSRVGPAVIGLWRPLIVLPEVVVRGKRPDELKAIIAHELIHVRRGDLWLGLLQVCAKAVWWFYPLVWWVSRASTREAERCCDEEVIGELGCDPRQYARSLLQILELKRSLQPVPAFPGMRPVEITSQRMERIMKLGQGCRKRTPRLYWLLMTLLAAAALPGAKWLEGEDGTQPLSFAPPAEQRHASVDNQDGPKANAGHLVVSSYRAADLVEAVQKKWNCSQHEARLRFGHLLIQQSHLSEWPFRVRDRVRIWKGALAVAASQEEHQRMAAAVDRMRKCGIDQVTMRVRFLLADPSNIRTIVSDWELIPSELVASRRLLQDMEPLDRPLPSMKSTSGLERSEMTTTTMLPVKRRIVPTGQAAGIVKRLESSQRTRSIGRSAATLFSGQSGVLRSTSGSSVQAGDEVKNAQSRRQVVKLRPLIHESGGLSVNYQIQQVVVDTRNRSTPLSAPKIHTALIESAAKFRLGETMIIVGLPSELSEDGSEQLVVLLSAESGTGQRSFDVDIVEAKDSLEFGARVRERLRSSGKPAADHGPEIPERIRLSVLGPITVGGVAISLDPPSDQEIISALERSSHSLPASEPMKITKKKIAEYTDPPRHVPMIGVARLHHVRYQCTAVLMPRRDGTRPEPQQNEPARLIVYVDHQHYHMLPEEKANKDPSTPGETDSAADLSVAGEQDDLYAVVYSVADLVAPTTEADGEKRESQGRDLSSLAVEITQQVQPDTWQLAGGSGRIRAFPQNFGIVVSQTHSVHSAIAGYLTELRQKMGLAAGSIPTPADDRRPEPETVINKVYNVADLVVPLPGMSPPHTNAVADFEALMKLIRSTVEPESWNTRGGFGELETFPTNLSLVVSQTPAVHRKVARLLNQLRRLQEVQICLNATFVRLPSSFWDKLGTRIDTLDGRTGELVFPALDESGVVMLSRQEALLVRRAFHTSADTVAFESPAVTIFNGQQARVGLPSGTSLQFQAVSAADRRSVRLSLSLGDSAETDSASVHTIADGQTLMMKVPRTLNLEAFGNPGLEAKVSGLQEWRDHSSLSRVRAPRGEHHTLLLVTPWIIVQEEEEARLSLQ